MSRFDWDDKKARANLKKHRISFEDAVTAFDDPYALIVTDDGHSDDDELREILIGLSDNHGVVVVVFTERESVMRIISARKANKQEIKNYENYR